MSNFRTAKDVYFDNLRVDKDSHGVLINWDSNSVYARCAQLGLCFKCKREDANPDHRPRHKIFGLCPECDAEMSYGYERIDRKSKLQVHKWFKD